MKDFMTPFLISEKIGYNGNIKINGCNRIGWKMKDSRQSGIDNLLYMEDIEV